MRQSTASQGLPEKVADPTILRKVAILMRPGLAGRSMLPARVSLPEGSRVVAAKGALGPHPAASPVERARTQIASDHDESSILVGLSDADCVQLERAATLLLHALEARRGQIRND